MLTVILSASAVAEGRDSTQSPWSNLDRGDKFGSEALFDLMFFLLVASFLVVVMIRPIRSPWTPAAIALGAGGLGAFRWTSLVSLVDRGWDVTPAGVVGVVTLLVTGLLAAVHTAQLRRAQRIDEELDISTAKP